MFISIISEENSYNIKEISLMATELILESVAISLLISLIGAAFFSGIIMTGSSFSFSYFDIFKSWNDYVKISLIFASSISAFIGGVIAITIPISFFSFFTFLIVAVVIKRISIYIKFQRSFIDIYKRRDDILNDGRTIY